MERVTAGDILSATFQFVRDHLTAMAIWSGIYLATIVATQFAMRNFLQMQLSRGFSGQALGLFLVIYLVTIAILIALQAAIFRAALDPDHRGISYFRIGMDELRLFLLLLLLGIGFSIALLIVYFALAIASIGLVAMGRIGAVFGVILGIVGFLGLIAGTIFFVVRLASAGPLTILRKKIIVGESWRLTRGHFWTLLGAYAVIAVIWILVFLVIILAVAGSEMQALFGQMRHPGDPVYQQQLLAMQMEQMNFGLWRIIVAAVTAILYVFLLALQCGSIAIGTRLLLNKENLELSLLSRLAELRQTSAAKASA